MKPLLLPPHTRLFLLDPHQILLQLWQQRRCWAISRVWDVSWSRVEVFATAVELEWQQVEGYEASHDCKYVQEKYEGRIDRRSQRSLSTGLSTSQIVESSDGPSLSFALYYSLSTLTLSLTPDLLARISPELCHDSILVSWIKSFIWSSITLWNDRFCFF